MDLGSTLGDLANRFTNDAQVEKLQKFIEDTQLPENVKTRLTSAIDRSKKNIEWDTKRLVEVKSYFSQGGGGSASVHLLSAMVPILSAMIYVFLN